jgi:predicted CoA-substrate-specific enzyme activase
MNRSSLVTAGVDIGSTATKAVVLRGGTAIARVVGRSSRSPARSAREIYGAALSEASLREEEVSFVVGTGYGRTQVPFAHRNISEITCHGRGAHHLRPAVRTVIDIGGQDTKVIHVDARGELLDFVMNDKCAAGTGRFLEAMARSLELSLERFAESYQPDGEACRITSMCSVFAESEVINLINDGVPLPRIVGGIFQSLAGRVAALALRIGLEEEVALTGGVARSPAVRELLERRLKLKLAPLGEGNDPQIVGALGAALCAAELASAGTG